jgi:hypothetical protein
MHHFQAIAIAGLLSTVAGCRTANSNANLFHAVGGENAKDVRTHFADCKHVFVACIYEDHWEDRGPGRLAPHHFKATVIKTFKGDWRFSERVAFVHCVDAPALTITNADAGSLIFVATNEHTDAEIGLDTGDFGKCDADLECALELAYPERGRR